MTRRSVRRSVAIFAVAMVLATSAFSLRAQDRKASGGQAPVSQAEQANVRSIESTIVTIPLGEGQPPLQLSLPELMKAYDIPGFSIAVIRNFKVVWAKGYGLDSAQEGKPVTTKTLFQAASISKPVTASAALALVEQGKLALNDDVNEKLKSWKVPENQFTQLQKVTLRELISHIGGFNVHGFRGYDRDEPRPTLVQILKGEKPANNPPLRVEYVPASKEVYSGGGIEVEQLLMTDTTGQDFATLMQNMVLTRAGMVDSTYQQPLPQDKQSLAAAGTHTNGQPVHGRWFVYPEQAAAGLWTTPSDLAAFAIEIALSRNGRSNKILSQAITTTMLTPWSEGGATCFHMDKLNPGEFSHSGENEGFEGQLQMNWKSGDGVAMMANSENGELLWDIVFRRLDAQYGWNYTYAAPPKTLLLIARVRGAQAALDQFTALRKSGIHGDADEAGLNQVGYSLLASGRNFDAILVFKRNVEEFPASANAYDSLAEAYAKAGQKNLAIENYEKSIQLNPDNGNAKQRLNLLKQ